MCIFLHDVFIFYDCNITYSSIYIIQICSGITRGKVLNGELYTQRLQKLIYLYFMKIALQSSGQIIDYISIILH